MENLQSTSFESELAIKYQIMIMIAIFSCSNLSVLLSELIISIKKDEKTLNLNLFNSI